MAISNLLKAKRSQFLLLTLFLVILLIIVLVNRSPLHGPKSRDTILGRAKGRKSINDQYPNTKVENVKSESSQENHPFFSFKQDGHKSLEEQYKKKNSKFGEEAMETNLHAVGGSKELIIHNNQALEKNEVSEQWNKDTMLGAAKQELTSTTASYIPNEPVTDLPPLPTFFPSKDLFVRAVYFDSRPRDGHHNTSVFLVVCMRDITANKWILGCQVDGRAAVDFDVKLIGETPLWRAFYDQINHEEVLVHCYDLPVHNKSIGYIKYKKSLNSEVLLAASERPLIIPPPRYPPSSTEGRKYNMTIVTCAKVFENPPWIEKWLTYQRTLGVDHVHLDAEDTFRGLNRPYIQAAIKEGFLSIDIWKKYLGVWEIWYHNQGLIYEDCPYRFRGTYDYIVMLDTDDFFTPRVVGETKLHYYIDKYCRKGNIGSCKFKWVEYYPDVYGFNNVSTLDGNVTRALKNYSHYMQGNPKSLHKTTVLIDTATHYAYQMIPGYRIVFVPVNVAYVAHVRLYKKLPRREDLVIGLPNTCSEHVISKFLLFVTLMLVQTYSILISIFCE